MNEEDLYIIENWDLLNPLTQNLCRSVGICPEEVKNVA